MLSQSELKYIKSLHQLKYRQKYGIFIVEGVKLASEVLSTDAYEIEGVYALSSWLDANNHLIDRFSNKIFEVSTKELGRISLLKSPNQVLITLKTKANKLSDASLINGLSLYLEDIRDPGNLGTILRIADWFGVKWVLCSDQCVEVYNPKVIQASMGAFLRVNTETISLNELKEKNPTVPIVGTTINGEPLFDTSVSLPAILVIGNESKGISAESIEILTKQISIPRHPDGGAESLNAAVATGIVCAFLSNQKRTI